MSRIAGCPKVIPTKFPKATIKSITTFAVRQDGEYMAAHGDQEFQDYAEILNRYL